VALELSFKKLYGISDRRPTIAVILVTDGAQQGDGCDGDWPFMSHIWNPASSSLNHFDLGLYFQLPHGKQKEKDAARESLVDKLDDMESRFRRDTEVACSNLKHCIQSHGLRCEKILGRKDIMPIYVIDTKQYCIRKSTTRSNYFALSYVWGRMKPGGPGLTLKQDNVHHLAQHGALLDAWEYIPRVIREAIEFVRNVGLFKEQHLWVDSLCIVQDDDVHKHDQIHRMDVIYGQAVMTIAAIAAKSAVDGKLLRYEYKRQAESLRRDIDEVERCKGVQVSLGLTVNIPVKTESVLKNSAYSTRAWTFQEHILSRRVLYCTDRQALFRCSNSETGAPGHGLRNDLLFEGYDKLASSHLWEWESRDETRRRLAIIRYCGLVFDYTGRYFSYRIDVLKAFSGVMQALTPGGVSCAPFDSFVGGIPTDSIAYGLFWTPGRKQSLASGTTISQTKGPGETYPTWSWARCAASHRIVWPDIITSPTSRILSSLQGTTVMMRLIQTMPKSSTVSKSIMEHHSTKSEKVFEPSEDGGIHEIGSDTFYFLHLSAFILPWSDSLIINKLDFSLFDEDSPWSSTIFQPDSSLWGSGRTDVTAQQIAMEDPTKLFILVLYIMRQELAALIVRELHPNVYGRLGIVRFNLKFSALTQLRDMEQTAIFLA
jgi:hypothetical protein